MGTSYPQGFLVRKAQWATGYIWMLEILAFSHFLCLPLGHLSPQSCGFLSFCKPCDLLNAEIKPRSPTWQALQGDSLPSEPLGKPNQSRGSCFGLSAQRTPLFARWAFSCHVAPAPTSHPLAALCSSCLPACCIILVLSQGCLASVEPFKEILCRAHLHAVCPASDWSHGFYFK